MQIASILAKLLQTASTAGAVLDSISNNPAKANDPAEIRPLTDALRAAIEANTEATRALLEEHNQTQAELHSLRTQIAALTAPA